MKIVVAPDSFKESLSAAKASEALRAGIHDVDPSIEVVAVPMADGGEGTVDALVAATGGRLEHRTVTGPLGDPVEACLGLLGDGTGAVIEMAAASGLPLVPRDRRNPMITTTRGTGELIRAALELGARWVVLGIGGSATVDGGAGMAQALGVRLLDAHGQPIGPGGRELERLARIDMAGRDPRLSDTRIEVACDVDNPLTGPCGAAAVYGPQKGATADMVEQLDANLAHLSAVVERELGIDVDAMPGAGAAGGLGAGLVAFCGATLKPGIEIVTEAVGLSEKMAGADLCVTGEGAIDRSSCFGKTIVGVASVAGRHGVPVVAVAGALGPGAEDILEHGVRSIVSICPGPMTLDEAIARAPELLRRTAANVVRLFLAGRGTP